MSNKVAPATPPGNFKTLKQVRSSKRNIWLDPEGLGKDFESTPYQPPCKFKAEQHANVHKFRNGDAPFFRTHSEDLGEMGIGISLYFVMVKYLTVVTMILAFINLPSMLIYYYGDGFPAQEKGILAMALTTVASLGTGSTFVDFLDLPITTVQVSYLVSFLDFVGSMVFIGFIVMFSVKVKQLMAANDSKFVSTADYSIIVRGLPADATEDEVRAHFDNLFQLSKPDWCFPGYFCGLVGKKKSRGPGIKGSSVALRPVTNWDHSLDVFEQSSWCAEVTMAYNDGSFLRRFMGLRSLNKKLRRARAAVKYVMARDGNTNSNPIKEKRARQKLAKVEKKFAKQKKAIDRIKSKSTKHEECTAAFIIFKHEESYLRCVHDYIYAKKWWLSQPPPLRFRGKFPLSIKAAPEPSNILWENLSESSNSRFVRRSINNCITAVLLIISLICIFAAQRSKTNSQMSFDICTYDIPASINLDKRYEIPNFDAIQFERNTDADALCPEDKLWMSFNKNSFVKPEDLDTIVVDGVQQFNLTQFDECSSPCIDPSGTGVPCKTLGVAEGCPSTSEDPDTCGVTRGAFNVTSGVKDAYASQASCCTEFTYDLYMSGCYCFQVMEDTILELGVVAGVQKLYAEELDMCQQFGYRYVTTQALIAAAVFVVLAVNVILKVSLKSFGRFERHHTVTEEHLSITEKIFVAQFMNTALVVLLVNGKITVPDQYQQYMGEFSDFTRDWYTVVGVSVLLTMLINTLVPHISPCFRTMFILPYKKRKLEKRASTQQELNSIFKGGEFDLSLRYPLVLNTMFVALFYGGPMPVLWPIASLSFFVTFWVDKYLIMYVYRKPPQYDERLVELVINVLPFGILLHFAISFWAFGNNDVLPSNKITGESLGVINDDLANLVSDATNITDSIGFMDKAQQVAAFPHLLASCLFIAFYVLHLLVGPPLMTFLWKLGRTLTCGLCFGTFKRREYNPPFTETYQKVVRKKKVLTEDDIRQGMKLVTTANGLQIQKAVWTTTGMLNKVAYTPGQEKRTWEVIASGGLHSYRMEMNPKYQEAMQASAEINETELGG